jgi:hypothetical protein
VIERHDSRRQPKWRGRWHGYDRVVYNNAASDGRVGVGPFDAAYEVGGAKPKLRVYSDPERVVGMLTWGTSLVRNGCGRCMKKPRAECLRSADLQCNTGAQRLGGINDTATSERDYQVGTASACDSRRLQGARSS